MTNNEQTTKIESRKYLNLRNPLFIGGIFIAVTLYYLGTEFIAPRRNVISIFLNSIIPPTYNFYSGNSSGYYFQIGEGIQNATEIELLNLLNTNQVTNIESGGATDNLLKVAYSQKSLGLIQEDTINGSLIDQRFIDGIYGDFRMVAPLYTEKLHILYRPIEEIIDRDEREELSRTTENLTLTARTKTVDISTLSKEELNNKATEDASYYLSHPEVKLNLGDINSGSLLLAHALLEKAGVADFSLRESNDSFEDALKRFQNKEIHVLFYIVGSPLEAIKIELENNAQLMNIKGIDIIQSLHEDFGFILRPSYFKNEYRGTPGENVVTFSTQAVLIASRDISNNSLLGILKKLSDHIDNTNTPITTILSPDDLANTIDLVTIQAQKEQDELVRDILIFLLTVFIGTIVAIKVLNEIISNLKKVYYFKQIQKIRYELDKIKLSSEEAIKDVSEKVGEDASNKLPEIRQQIKNLFQLKKNIWEDYQTGGVTDDCIEFLEDRLEIVLNLGRDYLQRFFIASDSKTINHLEMMDAIINRFIDYKNISSQEAIDFFIPSGNPNT